MAGNGGGTGSRRCVLWLMVLAAAPVAWVPRGNRGRGALAMAGGDSLRSGVFGCATLRLGLRVDGTRHARTFHSAAAISSRGFLPLCAQPDVRGLCRRMDRAVDRVRTR